MREAASFTDAGDAELVEKPVREIVGATAPSEVRAELILFFAVALRTADLLAKETKRDLVFAAAGFVADALVEELEDELVDTVSPASVKPTAMLTGA
jgi:hypothetical protein